MNASHDNRASHAEASRLAKAQNPRTVVPMSTSDRTATNAKVLRILVPINANDDSRWGVRYALHRHREGKQVEAILLNVGEPITQWQVLRFRTQQEIAQFQSECAQAFIEEATKPLAAENIPCRGFFRQGNAVFSILDTAEELDCDEIVMPEPNKGLPSLFSRGIVHATMRQQRDIPIVAVNSDGIPTRYPRK
jgi:nucleotide-binding universal stress UspA family protein